MSMMMRAELDPRWQSVVARDRAADGTFFYSVATTGVFCRPSCAARLANPKNVRFHPSAADAVRAGFRPCKRCKPDQAPPQAQLAAKIAAVCRRIETAEEAPDLATLAKGAGLSPYHFHRVFKAATGLTPRGYAMARRGAKLRQSLPASRTVTEAIYDSGFNASSRFYEQAGAMLGMPPAAYRDGGAKMTIRFAVGECALGAILAAESDKGVCAISLGDDPEALVQGLQAQFPKADLVGGDAAFERRVAMVAGFVEAPWVGLDLPLDVRGTAFQQRVWQALRQIPAGQTVSYTEMAARIGAPRAVRAVASACAANTLAVAIPCHRVVRTDGGLAGYRWGVERKQALLAREKA
jgi:AraC family transcriptional regulator of adaptative response/methylated-DNA-[protein]-cysteine methyltransferase